MEELSKEYVQEMAETILQQLTGTTQPMVMFSWGMEKLLATQVIEHSNGDYYHMAALSFIVHGFNYKGKLLIAYDEGVDYYRILGTDEEGELVTLRHDICFDQLGEVLDQIIEKGDMTEEEYLQRIEKEYAG
jgi:hypothetical protein